MVYFHVFPVGDILPHNMDGDPCPCEPDFERTPSGAWLVIHNAFDAREEDVHQVQH